MSPGLPEGTRLRVTAGSPTAQEIAALAAALDAGTGLAAGAASTRPPSETDTPAWALAARREALGDAPAATPADLRRPIRRR